MLRRHVTQRHAGNAPGERHRRVARGVDDLVALELHVGRAQPHAPVGRRRAAQHLRTERQVGAVALRVAQQREHERVAVDNTRRWRVQRADAADTRLDRRRLLWRQDAQRLVRATQTVRARLLDDL